MLLTELLCGVEYRLSPDSAPLGEQEVTRIVTAPTGELQNALYICTGRAVDSARDGMACAYANGCRLFLCAHDAYPGEGCVIVLCECPEALAGELTARLLGYPARKMTVIGISGMVGKTSVALLLEQILKRQEICVFSLTSRGFSLEKGKQYPRTTVPDAVEIQYALQKMAAAGAEVAILEFSAYQLAHFAAKLIPFAAVLLTNTEYFCQIEDFDRSLARKREALPRLLEECSGFSLLPCGTKTKGSGKTLWLGKDGDAFVREGRVRVSPYGKPQLEIVLQVAGAEIAALLSDPAPWAAENAAAAALLARVIGVTPEQISQALCEINLPVGLCCIYTQKERLVYTDSGYLPQHLAASLSALRKHTAGRLCVLLGSVGGRAHSRRMALGRVAAEYADFVYLTADDPDAEDVRSICAQMLDGMAQPERAVVIPDRVAAIKRGVSDLRPGDVLLLFGKGSLDFQLIGGVRTPLNEKNAVLEQAAQL